MNMRKIQKTGVSTMTISLPKIWVSEHRLKPGDPVIVRVMNDGTLHICPATQREEESTKKILQISNESREHLTRKLIATYLAGYDIIEVRAKDRFDLDLKRAVKDFSKMVIGPEVIEETSNSVVLHDLSDPMELPQQKCVRRMHLIAKSMHVDAMLSFERGDTDLARDVIDRDTEIDRLYWMVIKQYNLILRDRYFAEKMDIDVYDGLDYTISARGIERIGDHAEKIARNALLLAESNTTNRENSEITRSGDAAVKIFDRAIEALFLKDTEKANDVIDRGNELVELCEKMRANIASSQPVELVAKTTVIDSITRTIMYSMDIAEIAINGAMRKSG
jgi:phosphate uptake regulator